MHSQIDGQIGVSTFMLNRQSNRHSNLGHAQLIKITPRPNLFELSDVDLNLINLKVDSS